jgi:two-component system response regulator ChvI
MSSEAALSSEPAGGVPAPTASALRILLIDDDDDFRESLTLSLLDEGFAVDPFPGGAPALEHLKAGGNADVILLDWRMPGMDGLEVLRQLRRRGVALPVIFLTGLTDDVYEEAALAAGAVDFVDKARRWSILFRRIELIADAARAIPGQVPAKDSGEVDLGPLELRSDINRARWAGKTVDLTLTEFRILSLLVAKPDHDVSYREIYDIVRGKDFVSGQGPEGYRDNVRTFIKRIRLKFREIDPGFDRICNYARFGYRWSSVSGIGDK